MLQKAASVMVPALRLFGFPFRLMLRKGRRNVGSDYKRHVLILRFRAIPPMKPNVLDRCAYSKQVGLLDEVVRTCEM